MRSSEVTTKAAEILASGLLGEIKMTKAWNCQRQENPKPIADTDPPKGVEYDLWLDHVRNLAEAEHRIHPAP